MPRPNFANDNFYHIFNRGVDKRITFNEAGDYLRFIHSLFEFNDENIVGNFSYRLYRHPMSIDIRPPQKPLVDVVCFCLMPNHFHLVLKQLREGGVSKFMQKMGNGYTKYFNKKYKRNGVLFQGKFKSVPITTDAQFLHISRYIHLNPVELVESGWKEKGIKDWKKVQKFLDAYHWSSYLNYMGKKHFSSIVRPESISGQFKNKQEYRKFIKDWAVKDFQQLQGQGLILE